SRFFQQEARIANAQFAATLGFDRLRADIARAGFMTTANVQRDPFLCGGTAGWDTGMKSLAAVRIIAATPNGVQDPSNGLAPDQLTLTGSYSSVESFPIRDVDLGGGGFQVTLQQNNGGFVRSNMTPDGGGVGNLFQAGRVLRILDGTGHYEFGAITGSSVNASGEI